MYPWLSPTLEKKKKSAAYTWTFTVVPFVIASANILSMVIRLIVHWMLNTVIGILGFKLKQVFRFWQTCEQCYTRKTVRKTITALEAYDNTGSLWQVYKPHPQLSSIISQKKIRSPKSTLVIEKQLVVCSLNFNNNLDKI